jgi:hypothetical protein
MGGMRKIAAILVADVVGYSRLAGADEDRTLSRLRGLRSDLIDPAIDAPEFRGEVQPPASLKGLDIPSRRAVFVPWKPSRRRAFGMGNPTFR